MKYASAKRECSMSSTPLTTEKYAMIAFGAKLITNSSYRNGYIKVALNHLEIKELNPKLVLVFKAIAPWIEVT